MRCPNFDCGASPAAGPFFLRTELRKLHAAFSPRFLAGLGLRAFYQLQQTASAATQIDVITGSEFSWLCQKTVRIDRVENQLPLKILLTGQHKGYRFVMSVNEQQKRVITDGFAFESDNINRIAA